MEQEKSIKVESNPNYSKREQLAIEAMKILLSNQGRIRRMSPISRIKFWLGGNGWQKDWRAFYDYNFEDTAKKSYMMADEMLKAETD